jgi:hypothetical protein
MPSLKILQKRKILLSAFKTKKNSKRLRSCLNFEYKGEKGKFSTKIAEV